MHSSMLMTTKRSKFKPEVKFQQGNGFLSETGSSDIYNRFQPYKWVTSLNPEPEVDLWRRIMVEFCSARSVPFAKTGMKQQTAFTESG